MRFSPGPLIIAPYAVLVLGSYAVLVISAVFAMRSFAALDNFQPTCTLCILKGGLRIAESSK